MVFVLRYQYTLIIIMHINTITHVFQWHSIIQIPLKIKPILLVEIVILKCQILSFCQCRYNENHCKLHGFPSPLCDGLGLLDGALLGPIGQVGKWRTWIVFVLNIKYDSFIEEFATKTLKVEGKLKISIGYSKSFQEDDTIACISWFFLNSKKNVASYRYYPVEILPLFQMHLETIIPQTYMVPRKLPPGRELPHLKDILHPLIALKISLNLLILMSYPKIYPEPNPTPNPPHDISSKKSK